MDGAWLRLASVGMENMGGTGQEDENPYEAGLGARGMGQGKEDGVTDGI